MNSKRPLTPGFLNKIDQDLLKNKPVLWSTRIHLALYYMLAFIAAVILISFIVPDDPRNYDTIYTWIILLGIISFLAFIFWIIFLLRFNVFKRFGKWAATATLKTFILYFLIISLIVAIPFIPPIVQSIRANAAYTSEELATDINNINLKLCRLERDSIDKRFARDTFLVRDSVSNADMGRAQYDVDTVYSARDSYSLIDTALLNDKLLYADSVQKLNDSIYVVFQCPGYTFVNNYSIRENSRVKMLGSMDLFRQVLRYRHSFDTARERKELNAVFSKYDRHKNVFLPGYEQYDVVQQETGFTERMTLRYNLYEISSSLDNIASKKYRWDRKIIVASLRAAYYIALVLSLLVLIYRHTTRKTFFLSLLTAVILTILTGLFLAMSYSYDNDSSFFIWVTMYFVIFSITAATISNSSQRNAVAGIGLNLLVFITVFMPLVVTAAYYMMLYEKYRAHLEVDKEVIFENERTHYFIAEIAGFILLLVLLATLYQKAYRKWYALPEQ